MHSAHYAIARCLSVRPTILVFAYKTVWQYSDGERRGPLIKIKTLKIVFSLYKLSKFNLIILNDLCIYTLHGKYSFGQLIFFKNKNGFPKVIGAADCMHIAIKAPTPTGTEDD